MSISASAPPPALPPPNGTFVFARGGDSVGLDPAHEDDGESLKVAENIFEGRVEFNRVLKGFLAEVR